MTMTWEKSLNLDQKQLLKLYPPLADRTLRANMLMTTDFCIAAGGSSRPLSNPTDRMVLGHLRQIAEGVIVSASTAISESYRAIRTRPEYLGIREQIGLAMIPLLVVVTTHASRAKELASNYRSIGYSSEEVQVVLLSDECTTIADVISTGAGPKGLSQLKEHLQSIRTGSWLCEGGPTLLRSLRDIDWLDEFCMTITKPNPDIECNLRLDLVAEFGSRFQTRLNRQMDGSEFVRLTSDGDQFAVDVEFR